MTVDVGCTVQEPFLCNPTEMGTPSWLCEPLPVDPLRQPFDGLYSHRIHRQVQRFPTCHTLGWTRSELTVPTTPTMHTIDPPTAPAHMRGLLKADHCWRRIAHQPLDTLAQCGLPETRPPRLPFSPPEADYRAATLRALASIACRAWRVATAGTRSLHLNRNRRLEFPCLVRLPVSGQARTVGCV